MSESSDASLYCLHIEILDSEPAIWRKFCVSPEVTLPELATVLAAVMGWSGTADYRFKPSQPPGQQTPLDVPATDAGGNRLKLKHLVAHPGDSFSYTYNPSLGWLHTVTLENSSPPDSVPGTPHCLAGEQNCPPEFCVGIWGYEELLDRLSDPDDPEYDLLWEKVGYDFDPAWFDGADINRRLAALSLNLAG